MDARVQLARAVQIVAERLFDHDALPALSACCAQARRADRFHHRPVITGLRGEIVQNVRSGPARQLFFDAGVELRVVQVAGDVMQISREAGPQVLVEGAVFQKLLHRSCILARNSRRSWECANCR